MIVRSVDLPIVFLNHDQLLSDNCALPARSVRAVQTKNKRSCRSAHRPVQGARDNQHFSTRDSSRGSEMGGIGRSSQTTTFRYNEMERALGFAEKSLKWVEFPPNFEGERKTLNLLPLSEYRTLYDCICNNC